MSYSDHIFNVPSQEWGMAEDLIVGLTTDDALRRCFSQVANIANTTRHSGILITLRMAQRNFGRSPKEGPIQLNLLARVRRLQARKGFLIVNTSRSLGRNIILRVLRNLRCVPCCTVTTLIKNMIKKIEVTPISEGPFLTPTLCAELFILHFICEN